MIAGHANVAPVTPADAEKLEAAYRRAADGHIHGEPMIRYEDTLGLPAGRYVLGVSTRWTRARRKLKRAIPSLLLLAGCGVWAFAPQLMNSLGVALFTIATVLNLVGCVRQ